MTWTMCLNIMSVSSMRFKSAKSPWRFEAAMRLSPIIAFGTKDQIQRFKQWRREERMITSSHSDSERCSRKTFRLMPQSVSGNLRRNIPFRLFPDSSNHRIKKPNVGCGKQKPDLISWGFFNTNDRCCDFGTKSSLFGN